MLDKLREHQAFIIILSLYAALALLYGVTIPIFETPDAGSHYTYIHELTEGRGLPVLGEASGERVTAYAAGRPPLYYALSAALTFWVPNDANFDTWAWENPHQALGTPGAEANKNAVVHVPSEKFPWRGTPLTMHVARLVSTALGAVAVVATYGIARELFPNRRWLALGAASLTAFNPMFVFISSRVGDDAAVAAFGSLTVWGAVRLAVRGLSRRNLALTGAALGLAVLSKLSALALAPIVIFALARKTLKADPSQLVIGGLIVFATAALVCGWWFVRNYRLYGDPLALHPALGRTESGEHLGAFELAFPNLKSYWAMFGWFNISAPPWMYHFWQALVVLAGAGLIVARREIWSRGMCILTVTVVFTYGAALLWGYLTDGIQGRWLMVSVAPISILLMFGLNRLSRKLSQKFFSRHRRGNNLAVFLGGSHVVFALVCLFAFIQPVYAGPTTVRENRLPKDMKVLNLSFEDTPVELVGGIIEAESAHPGDVVPVSIYWRATAQVENRDLMTFVQILGRDMKRVAGIDCYPGQGNFPPVLWEPNVIYRDRYRLHISENTRGPATAALHAGLYVQDGSRLKVQRNGTRVDVPLLDRIPLRPQEPLSDEPAHLVGAHVGDAIKLVGYDLSSVDHQLPLTVTLTWRAGAAPKDDYTAFVHLVNEDGELVAQSDHPPLEGEYRTSFWSSGDVVRSSHNLSSTEGLEQGIYTLLVGMYDSQTIERLPTYDKQGNRCSHDAIAIGTVRLR